MPEDDVLRFRYDLTEAKYDKLSRYFNTYYGRSIEDMIEEAPRQILDGVFEYTVEHLGEDAGELSMGNPRTGIHVSSELDGPEAAQGFSNRLRGYYMDSIYQEAELIIHVFREASSLSGSESEEQSAAGEPPFLRIKIPPRF